MLRARRSCSRTWLRGWRSTWTRDPPSGLSAAEAWFETRSSSWNCWSERRMNWLRPITQSSASCDSSALTATTSPREKSTSRSFQQPFYCRCTYFICLNYKLSLTKEKENSNLFVFISCLPSLRDAEKKPNQIQNHYFTTISYYRHGRRLRIYFVVIINLNTNTCRTAFPAQHLRPSGVLSCWPDDLDLSPGFYPGSHEQHLLETYLFARY